MAGAMGLVDDIGIAVTPFGVGHGNVVEFICGFWAGAIVAEGSNDLG